MIGGFYEVALTGLAVAQGKLQADWNEKGLWDNETTAELKNCATAVSPELWTEADYDRRMANRGLKAYKSADIQALIYL